MTFFKSKQPIELPSHNCLLPHALRVPSFSKLIGKRVILASSSPRRKEILQTIGLEPEIVPSTFDEDLDHSQFEDVHEYPVATATQKAVEVYQRLVAENPDDPPDLVIGADTVVLTHPSPNLSQTPFADSHMGRQDILEKPDSKADNLRMLLDLNGGVCEVTTGVSVVYPVLEAPGYKIKSIEERTLVYFADNPRHMLEAYAENGEGLDRAGGFAVQKTLKICLAQGVGSVLVRKVEGDYQNVVGFPAASFFKFLEMLCEDEDDFLEVFDEAREASDVHQSASERIKTSWTYRTSRAPPLALRPLSTRSPLHVLLLEDVQLSLAIRSSITHNQPNAQIHVSTHGTDWLWACFAIETFSMLGMFAMTFLRPRGTRFFHNIALIMLTVSAIAPSSVPAVLARSGMSATSNGSSTSRYS
ncbi:hypothetical protein NM688_g8327 [Phlebia brevispora]|uniref:Uncharacterized protein n=1 Tax=Phlebia brevispora TaxID=194682 RepID=A0ACC1RTS7_9APHY|nr:hypothetical protein NM688_g8327 [Phlebia brevispora]